MSNLQPACATCLLVLLVGCTGHLNQENGLLGADSDTIGALSASSRSSISANEQPSLFGLDRGNWDIVQVLVPQGQVEVQPTYCEELTIATGTARDGGEYPTVASALQGESSASSIVLDGFIEPIWPAVLFVMTPVKMACGECPGRTLRQPTWSNPIAPPIQR